MTTDPFSEGVGRWFGSVDLDGAPPQALEILSELVRTLDALMPTLLDRRRSSVTCEGHGWSLPKSVEISLVHATDEEGTVTIVAAEDQAIISWLEAHEHVFPQDGSDDRPWTTVAVDATASILRAEYEVENHYKGDRLVKTKVIDVGFGSEERSLGTTGTLFSSWFPSRAPRRVERRRIDFGVGH